MFDGQRERDADQTVLTQIAEVGGGIAVGPEVVGVDGPEQRIVGIADSTGAASGETGNAPRRSAGESWKWSVAMWQSAQERPFAARPAGRRSKKARRPRSDGVAGLAAAERGRIGTSGFRERRGEEQEAADQTTAGLSSRFALQSEGVESGLQ